MGLISRRNIGAKKIIAPFLDFIWHDVETKWRFDIIQGE
jgi:hypothetical protein